MFEAFWAHSKIPVIVLLIIIRKFTISPFTSFFSFFISSFLPKSVFFGFCFLPDAFYIDVEPKLMMSEAVNDVCMSSLCFQERSFSSKFGDNISLVGMSWRQTFIGRHKNIALKMSLSPGNKSGDSFNFYLQKSIARWEPSFNRYFSRVHINFNNS